MKLVLLTNLCLLLFSNVLAQSYTIEDLRALERSKNYEEFLRHARDIRPSQRDKNWQEMVSHMATSFIQQNANKKNFASDTFKFIEEIYSWPTLNKDKLFAQLRTDYGLSYLENCYKKKGPTDGSCTEDSLKFWNSSQDKVRSGSGLGDLFFRYNVSVLDLWTLYKEAIKSPFSQYYCSKNEVQTIIINKLSLNVDFEYDTEETLNTLNEFLHPNCLKEMIPIFRDSLHSSNPVTSTMSFQILRAKNLIKESEADYFLTRYLLEGYEPGPLLNLAWNNLKKLSRSFSRRLRTVSMLKAMDPLPGKVFSLKDTKKLSVLANFLSSNLPEYFDYYAQTCIDYYEGAKKFPYGIPTPDCEGFFGVVKNNSLRSQELHLRYSALKK